MITYKVLIIDDDIWMQRILSKTLESYGFKESYLSSNGFDGVAIAVEKQPHLIVLDILMPELSGHLTLKMLKTIKVTKDIPVLMVSALSDAENLGKAVKIGTAGFISKPFTKATVFEKLIDVYGREKLDMIAKGEPIDMVQDFYGEDILQTEPDNNYSNEDQKPNKEIKEDDESDSEESEKTEKKGKKLLQFYQDDEQKSIESIKKLLLKKK